MGLSPREASRKAMDEVTGPVIAIALVLCAVFVPTAFMAGISGQFYQQFALTIAASTIISAFNSLTLSPALCALLLKPHGHGHGEARARSHARREALPRLGIAIIGGLVAYVLSDRLRCRVCWDRERMPARRHGGHGAGGTAVAAGRRVRRRCGRRLVR